jgi:hypothetical protein
VKSKLKYRLETVINRIDIDINLNFERYFGSMRAARKISNKISQILVERVDWKAT